ncbi:MAG: glycosyltransferase family 39 protein [Victivallales bacterium]|nr:glycosyltransferase family 39 protein [Victivallales bacterium]
MRRYFYLWAGLTVLFALFLRLMVARDLLANDPQVVAPSVCTDMYTYKKYSEDIVRGDYEGEFYYQPFYYVAFLPVVKWLFGFGPWPLIFSQCLISAATVWISIVSCSMLWGRRAGIISGLLVALSSVMIMYVPYHLVDTLQAFWVILVFYTVMKCCSGTYSRVSGVLGWGLAGVFTGLGILTRGNMWFFVPGLALCSVVSTWRRENSSLFRLLPAVVYLAMVILPQIPFSLRNTVVTGKLCGPSTAAGAVLALGNTPEAPPGGREPGMGPGPMEYPETYSYWMSTEESFPVWKRILAWVTREPAAFAELQWRKLLLFWDRREIPNNIAIEHQGLMSPLLQIFGLIPGDVVIVPGGKITVIPMNIVPASVILLVLGLSGVLSSVAGCLVCAARYLRKSAAGVSGSARGFTSVGIREQVLLYLVLSYCAGTVAFYILARFRLPVLPLLAVFAGGFLDRLLKIFSKGALSIRMCLALLASFFAVNFGYDFYRSQLESGIMRIARPHGVYCFSSGGSAVLKDNGPYTFGLWEPLELHEGVPIEKLFNPPGDVASVGGDGNLCIELVWALPGDILLEVDGKSYRLREVEPVRKKYEFAVSLDAPVSVVIRPLRMDARVYVAVDRQRNYSRTLVDGEKYPGELVCNLHIP